MPIYLLYFPAAGALSIGGPAAGVVLYRRGKQAAAVDQNGLALQVPVRWKDRPGTVRAQMAVSNVHGLPLFVGMQVTKMSPWKPTVYLILENEQLRRLDVNGSHTNRTPDGEQWTRRTHKHGWSEAHRDAVAYTPAGIPDVPLSDVTSQLRGVFEAFLAECHIQTRGAYSWSDPTLTTLVTRRMGEE